MIIHTINKQTPICASGQATWILIDIREGMWGGKEGSVMEDKLRTKYFYYMLNKFVQIQQFSLQLLRKSFKSKLNVYLVFMENFKAFF